MTPALPGGLLERLGERLAGGFQVIEASSLPHPLLLHLPTLVHVPDAASAGRTAEALSRLLGPETEIERFAGGEPGETFTLTDVAGSAAPAWWYLDPEPPGWPGLVATVTRLRVECPWDARQTHHSLARHLVEEAYELVDAIALLPAEAPAGPVSPEAYGGLRGELGDVLLQAVIHAVLASEAGAFGVEEVAEGTRRKLVRRHPHVFGDVEVDGAGEVIRNWERLKQQEEGRESLMDDVSEGLPALVRAAKVQRRASSVGLDWPAAGPVVAKVAEELDELREVLDDPVRSEQELGDLLFAVVNVARHLHADPEMALRGAIERFVARFRLIEREGGLEGLSLEELDARWERAKNSG